MKKFLILILSFVLLFSITACGDLLNSNNGSDNVESGNNSNEENNNTSNGGNGENNTENNNGNNTENNGNSEQKTFFEISYGSQFSDGVAIITLNEYEMVEVGSNLVFKETIKRNHLLIDTLGNIISNFDGENLSISSFSTFHNGVSIYSTGSPSSYKAIAVYDKNGEIIISSEKNGFDNIITYSADHKYFIVDKTEESFVGDKYMVGIIDNNGNYIEELSNTSLLGEIFNVGKENFSFEINYLKEDIFCIVTGSQTKRDTLYYHVDSKKLTTNYNHIEYKLGRLYKYDELGNETQLLEDKKIVDFFDNSALVYESYNDNLDAYEGCKLLDLDGHCLMDFSEYNLCGDFSYKNGYFLTKIVNNTRGEYYCFFDNNCNFVFEPIRVNEGCRLYRSLDNLGFKLVIDGDFCLYRYDGTKEILNFSNKDCQFVDGLEVNFNIGGGYYYINEKFEVVITAETIASKMN